MQPLGELETSFKNMIHFTNLKLLNSSVIYNQVKLSISQFFPPYYLSTLLADYSVNLALILSKLYMFGNTSV